MTQEELDELEWLRAWTDDLSEAQFNRLKQLEINASRPVSYMQESEQKADIPFSIKNGKVVPVDTNQTGADRVHFTDIKSMYREPANLTPEDVDPASGEKWNEINRLRSEGSYESMMDQIEQEQEKADVEEYYGWTNTPGVRGAMSLVAPSVTESIEEGKMPSWSDAAIDIPLAATFALPVARGASKIGTIGKNAAIGSGIGLATEGALQAAHDRPMDLKSLAMAGAFGSAGGAAAGKLTNMADDKIAKIATDAAGQKYIQQNLGSTQANTIANMYKDAPKNLRSMAKTKIGNITVQTGDAPYTFLDEANKDILQTIQTKRKSGDMAYETAQAKRELLKQFNESVLDLAASSNTDEIPFETLMAETDRLYKKDPELGLKVFQQLEPYVSGQRMLAAKMVGDLNKANPGSVDKILPEAQDLLRKSVSGAQDEVAKMRIANMYADEAPKAFSDPALTGDWTKFTVDKAKNVTPETMALVSRGAKSSGVRLAPKAGAETEQVDEQGNLIYAPQGQRGYDWLWEQADRMKDRK